MSLKLVSKNKLTSALFLYKLEILQTGVNESSFQRTKEKRKSDPFPNFTKTRKSKSTNVKDTSKVSSERRHSNDKEETRDFRELYKDTSLKESKDCSVVIEITENANAFISNRKDFRGFHIIKGKKKHRVSYLDELKEVNISDIIEVESYKAYNISNTHDKAETSCNCNII